MKRRRALQVLGASALTLAGCLSESPSTTQMSDTPSPTRTTSDASSPLVFEQGDDQGVLPETSFTFTLTNRSERTFLINFYAWTLWKDASHGWAHVAPTMTPQPLHSLPPGERHEWTLTVDNADYLSVTEPRMSTPSDITIRGLGGGQYKFTIGGEFEEGSADAQTQFAARFRLDGEPLALGPTDAIESVRRVDGTVEATANRPTADRPATYTLERITGSPPEEPDPIIVEQLLTRKHLRDAIYLGREYDADRVRLDDESGTIPAVSDGPRYVSFKGKTYRFDGKLDDPPCSTGTFPCGNRRFPMAESASVTEMDHPSVRRARRVSHLLDEAVEIPVVNYRVGLDPILGILPVGGDAISLLCSLYVVFEAGRAGASTGLLTLMVALVLVDFVVGSIPLLGTLFDAVWKANAWNVRLLERQLKK